MCMVVHAEFFPLKHSIMAMLLGSLQALKDTCQALLTKNCALAWPGTVPWYNTLPNASALPVHLLHCCSMNE